MFKVMLLTLGFFLSASSLAKTVSIDSKRLVKIIGPIYNNGIPIAQEIEALTIGAKKNRTIHILISSPGGSVVTGSQILSAVDVAKSRGFRIKCYVPVLAASMGFQVLVHCDERYTLKYSLLLFHPMRISFRGALTSEDLLYSARRLRAWEAPFIADLIEALGIDTKTFMYHYQNETLWMGYEFNELAPDFLTIVDDIKGVEDLFDL